MPTKAVPGRKGCYQWGDRGKIYCGAGAKQKADAQGRAVRSSGYKK